MTNKPYPSQTQDRYIVRFPDGMRERIAEAAKANNRSMNAEIVARLENSLAAEDSFRLELAELLTQQDLTASALLRKQQQWSELSSKDEAARTPADQEELERLKFYIRMLERSQRFITHRLNHLVDESRQAST